MCKLSVFMNQTSRFYLAFENSMCDDYVTEKLFDRMASLERPPVPVVMGGADYSQIVPERSVIDVRDFEGPADLAKYLRTVYSLRIVYE